MAKQKPPMVKCAGCGFHAEQEDVVELEGKACIRCKRCENNSDMRESYRRGFNDGVDTAAQFFSNATQMMRGNLRK